MAIAEQAPAVRRTGGPGTQRRLRVLIVSAQFPYPPHFGFATRVYQLARQLSARHETTLLSYVPPGGEDALARLREEVAVEVVEQRPASLASKRISQLVSVCSPHPFSCRSVWSKEMQGAIDRLCAEHRYDVIQLESSLLCTFRFPRESLLVLDEHNLEYEVFQRMQQGERSLPRRLFNRVEHLRFRRFEQRWWRQVAACVLTSEREQVIVDRHAPETPTMVVPNGVDVASFRPSGAAAAPHTMVFNGLLLYRPNLDAAYHLVDEIWPLVRARVPDAVVTIVGRGDPEDLRRLERPGVVVTGEVPDVRPYLERAAIVGVPVRMGGGTRLKVVEGLAMGKAMVSTSLGCEGVNVVDGESIAIADTAETFAASVVRLFEDRVAAAELGRGGRALMEREYSWEIAGAYLEELYRTVTSRSIGAP